jgi:hypothetical protein
MPVVPVENLRVKQIPGIPWEHGDAPPGPDKDKSFVLEREHHLTGDREAYAKTFSNVLKAKRVACGDFSADNLATEARRNVRRKSSDAAHHLTPTGSSNIG